MREDLALQLDQLWAGIEAEVLDEYGPGPRDRGQRIARPAGGVQRAAEPGPHLLPVRVTADEQLKRCHSLVSPAESEVGIGELRAGAESELGQAAALGLSPGRVRPVRIGFPAVQGHRGHELGPRLCDSALLEQRPAAGAAHGELARVDVGGRQCQGVARTLAHQETAR